MIIHVDTDDLQKLVVQGSKIVTSPEAEDALMKLLELQHTVDAAIVEAKKQIENTALAYDPNFTSVQSDKIKVGYRVFGAKYSIDPAYLEKLPAELYKTKVSHSADTTAIDRFIAEKGALPLGINPMPRAKQITIKPIEAFEDASAEDGL